MKIIDNIENYKINDKTVIALGNFDGIHKGHMELIHKVKNISENSDLKSGVLLFNEHTKNILNPNKGISKLTTLEDKLDILKELDLDYVFIVDFKSIFQLNPEEFIKLLLNRLNSHGIVVGKDYRFGNKAIGDIVLLEKLCMDNDIVLNIVDTVKDNDTIVKSTIIRRYISNGDIFKANKLLGRKYSIKGTVIHGEKRGRELGFPTVNIVNQHNYILPKEGVYYSNISILDDEDSRIYESLSFVGTNLTFNEYEKKIETYIFDFSRFIYGKEVKIEFIDFIRGNKRFDSREGLITQMNEDVKFVENYNKNLHF